MGASTQLAMSVKVGAGCDGTFVLQGGSFNGRPTFKNGDRYLIYSTNMYSWILSDKSTDSNCNYWAKASSSAMHPLQITSQWTDAKSGALDRQKPIAGELQLILFDITGALVKWAHACRESAPADVVQSLPEIGRLHALFTKITLASPEPTIMHPAFK